MTVSQDALSASLDHIRLLREKQAALAVAQIAAEEQLLHRAGVMYTAGGLDDDGLLSLNEALSPVALPGWTKRWDAAISLSAGRLPNLRKHLRHHRHNAPNEPDGTWRGTWPLNGGPMPIDGIPVVYVLYDEEGFCYVGSSDRFRARLQWHERDGKPFSQWSASRCADREAAYRIEERLLDEFKPYLNKRRGRLWPPACSPSPPRSSPASASCGDRCDLRPRARPGLLLSHSRPRCA